MKYTKNINRAFCILAAASMTLASASMFTGCSKNDSQSAENSAVQEQVMKTLTYKVDQMRVNNNISGNITYKDGKLYSVVSTYDEKDGNNFSSSFIVVFDETGNILQNIPVYTQEDPNEYGGVQGGLQIDDNGNITFMMYKGSWNEVTGESSNSQCLVTYDSTGNKVGTIDLDKVITQEDQDAGRYFNNYVTDKQGNIYLNLSSCVRVCDSSGNVLFTTEPLNNDNTWMGSMILTNSGVPVVSVSEYTESKSSMKLVEINLDSKGYGKEYPISSNMYNLYSGSGDYLCYSSGDSGIIGVRSDSMTAEPVISLLTLGVDSSHMDSFSVCEDGTFITTGYEWDGTDSATTITFIRPGETEEKAEKTVIELGCFSLDWNLRSVIADFNKENDKYLINVRSYSDSNDTSDYTAALTKFNNELLAGKIPDMLLVNSNMPYDSYVSKGLFADIYELMANDPVYNKDAFMPNVLTALERNGKLYSITPTFNVQTLAAKKSLVGDGKLTLDKTNEILASMGEGTMYFNYPITSSEFVSKAIAYSNFIDYSTGTCNFDNSDFKAILETAKTLPAEIDYDKLNNDNPDYWMESETACKENKALFYNAYIYDFESFYRLEKVYLGEEVTMCGFPAGESSKGALLNLSTQFAVSDKSKNKEGAWEFIKYSLDKTVQENTQYPYITSESKPDYSVGANILSTSSELPAEKITRYSSTDGSFPVVISQFNKIAEQSIKPYSYFDEEGKIVEQEQTFWLGNEEIKIDKLTKEDYEKAAEYLKSVTSVFNYDESVNNIVNEETAAFFSGTKSADETASIIQSRVSIYMSEQY